LNGERLSPQSSLICVFEGSLLRCKQSCRQEAPRSLCTARDGHNLNDAFFAMLGCGWRDSERSITHSGHAIVLDPDPVRPSSPIQTSRARPRICAAQIRRSRTFPSPSRPLRVPSSICHIGHSPFRSLVSIQQPIATGAGRRSNRRNSAG
jgi:hypothetical protein